MIFKHSWPSLRFVHIIFSFLLVFPNFFSGIDGFEVHTLLPSQPDEMSCFQSELVKKHIIFTAETHNFPTGKIAS